MNCLARIASGPDLPQTMHSPDPTVLVVGLCVDESRVQQQLDAPLEEHLLKNDRQDLVMEHGPLLIDCLEAAEFGEDCVEDLTLAGDLTAKIGDAATGHVAARHGKSFDQDGLCSGTGCRTGRRHAGDAASDDGDVGLVANGDAAGPGYLVLLDFRLCGSAGTRSE